MRYKPQSFFALTVTVSLLLMVIAGCVISPRRTFTGTPAPTPTPTDTPIPTATPTPTPTGGSTTVPIAQVLFVGDASGVSGFKINQDGSLMPMPGFTFRSAPVNSVASVGNTLIVATENSISAFSVNKEVSALQQTDSMKADAVENIAVNPSANAITAITQKGNMALRIAAGKLEPIPAAAEVVSESASVPRSTPAALDTTGKFMYVVNAATAEIDAFRVEQGRPEALTPASYPTSRSAKSLAVVKP
jgi:hypothetical protein